MLLCLGLLILSLSKESVIYTSAIAYSSTLIAFFLIVGSLYSIVYSFNIFLRCFFYSTLPTAKNPTLYSFLLPSLIFTSLILDMILEYHVNLNAGSLFYPSNRGTFFSCGLCVEHYSIPTAILLIIGLPLMLGQKSKLNMPTLTTHSSYSSFHLPISQELFI